MYGCLNVYMHEGTHPSQDRGLGSLELEFQMVVSHL